MVLAAQDCRLFICCSLCAYNTKLEIHNEKCPCDDKGTIVYLHSFRFESVVFDVYIQSSIGTMVSERKTRVKEHAGSYRVTSRLLHITLFALALMLS